jgi:hypothetical protein
MGTHVDGLKFAGGSFSLFQEKPLRELIDLAHDYGVYVSTGGWAEHLLTHPDANTVFDKYLKKCKDLGFVQRAEALPPVPFARFETNAFKDSMLLNSHLVSYRSQKMTGFAWLTKSTRTS